MLTVFHTADWHLGQSFFGFDRDYEHTRFFEWLLGQLESQRPDALIVAGDVFDSINPSATAQRRYYDFLAKAGRSVPGLQIVITAGNHDAGARLEAPSHLLNSLNITVIGTVSRNERGEIDLEKFLIPLKDVAGNTSAIVMAIPFLRPSDVPALSTAADPYLDGIRELYRQVTLAACEFRSQHCPDAALVAMGHCHLLGGEESRDSERRVVVGGAEGLAVDVFAEEIAYVALGHLHRSQEFREGRVRYCGSGIPLSFAESFHEHQIVRLQFEGQRLILADRIKVPRSVAMVRVPAREAALIDDVLPLLEQLPADDSLAPDEFAFLEVRLLEDRPDPTRRHRIEQAIEGKPFRLSSIKVEYPGRSAECPANDLSREIADLHSISEEEVFLNAHRERYGTEADDSLRKAFREILLQESHGG